MAGQQLIGALEAGDTKMVCATGYADGTVLEREQIVTTTPQETVEAVNAWLADKGIAALGIGPFGSKCAKGATHRAAIPSYGITPPRPVKAPNKERPPRTKQCVLGGLFRTYERS